MKAAQAADAVLLGAVGDPAFDREPAHRRPEAALLAIRRELGLYANLRPATVWPGLESAGPLKPEILAGTDMLVVRELTGGLYYGEPRGTPATAQKRTTRCATRATRSSASPAWRSTRPERRKKHVTSVDKANVLEVSRLWRAVVNEVARDYPDVTLDHQYVDACAMKIALAPVVVRRHPRGEHVWRHPVGRGRRGRGLAGIAAVGESR